MSHPRWATARTRALAAFAGVGLVAATLSTATSVQAAPAATAKPASQAAADPVTTPPGGFTNGNYMVTLAEVPAAAYSGGVKGYARTRPAKGKNFNAASKAVVKYRGYLKAKHNRLLTKVGATAYHDYTVALNGFAAHLTAKQAATLAKQPGVLAVQKDALRHPDADGTNRSWEFFGLDDEQTGLWNKVGGEKNAGKGVIVGVIDTGIWPESPSFAGKQIKRDRHGLTIDGQGIRSSWMGTCQAGEQWNVKNCNSKIIGARYFLDGFGKKSIAKSDYLSPRDGNGHGSHTSSTAAGNRVKDVVVDGTSFGTISGMAPAAQLAMYKVCWTGVTDDGCANSDSAAAVDQAVADGVDVINYSIGGTSEATVLDEVELAFMFASAANVYVAVSAGNSGPGASTLDHPSPWLTTTAASTYWISQKKLVLGDGQQFIGASTTAALTTPTPMVMAEDAALPGADPDEAAECWANTLDPAKVTGKMVVCLRGTIARIEKSFNVRDAGGVAMVQINPTENSLNGDLHAVPSVHLPDTALTPVTEYVRGGGTPTGTIVELTSGESDLQVPEVAEFSSRGPSTTTGGDILKPDLAAPGVDVLAAVAPPFNFGRSYDLYSGTSMASPHNAGLGALLMQEHPDWSPMEIKSALMTTAGDHASTDSSDGGVFAQGAGFVDPNAAADPGVVFDHGMVQWLGYLEGVLGADLDASFDMEIPTIDGSQINQASIALGSLAGVETVRRTLTNVSGSTETYTPTVDLPGIDVTSSHDSVTLESGESESVEITFTRTDAPADEYTTGSLTWTGDQGHTARMPLAVRPVEVAAPAEVTGSGTDGTANIKVTAGYDGTIGSAVSGLVGTTPVPDSVAAGSFDYTAPAESAATDRREVVVNDAKVVRFAIDGADGDDLDLWVYKKTADGEQLVALDADGDGDETVTLVEPEDGTYVAYVNGFATPSGGGYTWAQWLVDGGPAGNLTVTPDTAPANIGEDTTFQAGWSGLDPAQRYVGWIGWTKAGSEVGGTVVSIN